jgi:hypothetical protein
MKIAITDQRERLASYLPALRSLPFSYTDVATFPERRTTLEIPLPRRVSDLQSLRLDFFFDYNIFPPSIVTAYGEWRLHGRAMQPGDVIVQQASVPPGPLGLKMIFGVRVLSVTKSAREMGLSYGTLAGHAEMGIARFALTLNDDRVRATIHTNSQPAQFAARVVAPLLVNPYQQYCTNRALARLRDLFAKSNA